MFLALSSIIGTNGENLVGPFKKLAVLILIAFMLVFAIAMFYKGATGKYPSKEAFAFIQAIMLGLAFMAFLKFVM